MKNFLAKLGGRKFVIALFGLAAVAISALTGVDIGPYQDVVIGIVAPYLIGQGVADGLSGGATSSSPPEA